MKILIAGFGSIGRRHFRNLLELGERDILFYRTHRSTLPEDELDGFVIEEDLEGALSHHPDAVIISNPTALHVEVAIPAARSGCHLFLEKPISHSMERIDELGKSIELGRVKVLVGYQFRFHPGLQQVKRLLEAGTIGRPLSARAHWGEYLPAWHPWEDYRQGYSARTDLGGGVILTLSHPVDYMRWLLGEVTQVWALTAQASDLELDVEDTAEIGLRFRNGAIGSLHLDYNQQPTTHHLEIIGTEGTIQWDNQRGVTRSYQGGGSQQAGWESYPMPAEFERNDLFLAQMRHFLEVAKGTTTPRCTMEDGIRALQICLAAQQSQALGRAIKLDQKML